MRCRVGDLAVILRGEGAGVFVDVLVRAPDEPGTGHPAWIVRLKAPVRCTLMLYQRGGAPTRIRIVNVPAENLHPLIMIECPRLLFPFAREIIATSVRDGGFPPLMLDPVDFVGLYRSNMERQAQAEAGQAGPAN